MRKKEKQTLIKLRLFVQILPIKWIPILVGFITTILATYQCSYQWY